MSLSLVATLGLGGCALMLVVVVLVVWAVVDNSRKPAARDK
jgi:hypothetical protein